MRPVTLCKSLAGFLAFGQCHAAVTWTTIGCGANAQVDGKDITQMWNNAVDLSSNAQSKLDNLLNAITIHSREGPIARIASHVRNMFAIEYRFDRLGAIPSGSRGDVRTIRDNYKLVDEQMKANNGYIICSDADFKFTDDEPVSSGAWYVNLPGTETRMYLTSYMGLENGENNKPCSDPTIMGKTFKGLQTLPDGALKEHQAILLCDNNHRGRKKGTLERNFVAAGANPNPNEYGSASGTILHEMFHVVSNRFSDKDIPNSPQTENVAYMYNPCYWLAMENPVAAIENPDNYRILAEMLMSPSTSWAPPDDRT
ncbi:hypothetical protein NW762_008288 [Fusarium torreyae]|uniref:Lysine-specific metallo-endopeptidase domain-containing protein n=1 Tax=Fusarium torreyae TaxID=1237075 RepID=A0A9W8RW16_9HYPO|nr:hypothetical protein NW762_008288 [Fusarium torreyae]